MALIYPTGAGSSASSGNRLPLIGIFLLPVIILPEITNGVRDAFSRGEFEPNPCVCVCVCVSLVAALHKDMGSCRAATITGTLSRISLNDEEEKAPEGLNYSTLPGNIMSKVIIQQPSALHMPMGVADLKEQCMVDGNADMRRTVYLCTDDTLRQSEHDMEGHPAAAQMMETDYIVMPRASAAAVPGSCNASTLLKDESKMNIPMDALQHERLMHCKMSPDFNLGPAGMDHMNVNLEQHYPGAPEQMQNLPFEPRTAVKNFLAEMEESAGLSRSETGSTISMSSLEVRLKPNPKLCTQNIMRSNTLVLNSFFFFSKKKNYFSETKVKIF